MTRQEIVFPEEYKITKEGELFLLFDSGPTEDRILIFSTARNLRLLASSENWFGNGTFKTVPHLFYQLYTLHGIQVNSSIPLLYVLLPGKTEATHVRLLQQVKQLQPDASPETIMTDFEPAIVSASRQEFPMARHRGCFFHFSQCIFRRIQAKGLQRRYETDVEFAMKMRLLSALAFVPTEDVVDASEVLSGDNMPEEAQGVIDYFEDCLMDVLNDAWDAECPASPSKCGTVTKE